MAANESENTYQGVHPFLRRLRLSSEKDCVQTWSLTLPSLVCQHKQTPRPKKSARSWVVETTGDATCMKDYISMNAPVVELLSSEDLALALHYLDPTLSTPDMKSLFKKGDGHYCRTNQASTC